MATDNESRRLTTACGLLGGRETEVKLLYGEISEVRLLQSGTAVTYEVFFADDTKGAFKSFEGAANSASTQAYGHTATGVLLNDVSAWFVARGLGFDELVKAVVVRTVAEPNAGFGTLQVWHEGEPSADGWRDAKQLRQAALFDALIGQQDRNGTNFKYNPDTDALGLFDNSFSFALPGHATSASEIIVAARSEDPSLDDALLDALDQFAESEERGMLEQILGSDRWNRVVDRHARMLDSGEILEPFDF